MKTNLTVINSAAGGVGKTFIAINLAAYLTSIGKKVLLVDMSLYGGLDVNVRESKRKKGLSKLINTYEQYERFDLDEAIIKNHEALGCDVLLNSTIMRMESLSLEFIDKYVEALCLKGYDEIIFDTSSETCIRNSRLLQKSDKVIYILNQDVSVCWRSHKHLEIFDKLQIERKKIVYIMNSVRKDIETRIDEVEEELSIKITSSIKYYKSTVMDSVNHGRILYFSSSRRVNRELTKQFASLMEVN